VSEYLDSKVLSLFECRKYVELNFQILDFLQKISFQLKYRISGFKSGYRKTFNTEKMQNESVNCRFFSNKIDLEFKYQNIFVHNL